MKNEKKPKGRYLLWLYLDFIFQKMTWIIFTVSIILMSVAVFFASNPWMEEADYLRSSEDFHLYFMNQALFIVQVFNGIIIGCVVINLAIHSTHFDTLFASYISRKKICGCKVASIILICTFLCLYEMVLIFSIGMLRYSKFIITIEMITGYGYLFLSILFEAIISMIISTIFPVVFSPMLILFICIIIRLLCNNIDRIRNMVSGFFPVLNINSLDIAIHMQHIWIIGVWIILFFILLQSVYSVKDL